MPRRDFIADLQAAITSDSVVSDINNISQGEDDNIFHLTAYPPECPQGVAITCIVMPELSDYPKYHSFLIFAEDSAPKQFSAKLANAQIPEGARVVDVLKCISSEFCSGDIEMPDAQNDVDLEDEDEDDDDELQLYSDDDFAESTLAPGSMDHKPKGMEFSIATNRIRCDLLLAKAAGFKIGYHGGILNQTKCHVCVSIKISKLGISAEAMEAWRVDPSDYLILAIAYEAGYMDMDFVSKNGEFAKNNIRFRIGLSHTYKPTYEELMEIWDSTSIVRRDSAIPGSNDQTSDNLTDNVVGKRGWRDTFISQALHQLFSERLILILRSRYSGLSWEGAEQFVHDKQGLRDTSDLDSQYSMEPDYAPSYPEIVNADHIMDSPTGQKHSLPLLAMQFLLRHFVRSTEFCLVCHCKLKDTLEALKPYVCENELCLYQYLSLGFGPSIEHEIGTQPQVVDLLISFCYQTACKQKLTKFPNGLNLRIPNPEHVKAIDLGDQMDEKMSTDDSSIMKATFQAKHSSLILEMGNTHGNLKVGDWIQMRPRDHGRPIAESVWKHFRLLHKNKSGFTLSGTPVSNDMSSNERAENWYTSAGSESVTVYLVKYDLDIDALDPSAKQYAIMAQLDLLPRVDQMQTFLQDAKKPALANWISRIPTPALGILRWIIASNRACIMQVKPQDRVQGVSKEWIQFRFAMGAPDKEKRFIDAVNIMTMQEKLNFPTLFCWHGSPLPNWHSIIREGLNYDRVDHGRAYGNGVYFARDFRTSLGYTHYHNNGLVTVQWPGSKLGVSCALSLGEAVNAPSKFVSNNPYYVIKDLDWIQTRYLFVKCTAQREIDVEPIKKAHAQDPDRLVTGDTGECIVIPSNAIRVFTPFVTLDAMATLARKTDKHVSKKRKSTSSVKASSIVSQSEVDNMDDAASVATLDEDLTVFNDTTAADVNIPILAHSTHPFILRLRNKTQSEPHNHLGTDFVPGSLDHSKLPLFKAPDNSGISGAEQQLMRRFKSLQDVQTRTPIADLGWYIDPSQFNNVFQWIVELHTFDSKLPLARDMKDKGIASIVLEMRFQNTFPFSPPFVRVIRPRLLPFLQGGGGHVTAGGSLCMQLLTNDGWLATMDIESVLVSIRHELMDLHPNPARLDKHPGDYSIGEAVEGYIRACQNHGWRVPDGFKENILSMDVGNANGQLPPSS